MVTFNAKLLKNLFFFFLPKNCRKRFGSAVSQKILMTVSYHNTFLFKNPFFFCVQEAREAVNSVGNGIFRSRAASQSRPNEIGIVISIPRDFCRDRVGMINSESRPRSGSPFLHPLPTLAVNYAHIVSGREAGGRGRILA